MKRRRHIINTFHRRKKTAISLGWSRFFLGGMKSAAWQCCDNVFCLQAFVTVHDRELDTLAFDQNAMTFTANGTKVHENIITRVA